MILYALEKDRSVLSRSEFGFSKRERSLGAPSHRAFSVFGVVQPPAQCLSSIISRTRVGRLHLETVLHRRYRIATSHPQSPPNGSSFRRHLFATLHSWYQPIPVKANLGTMASLSMTSSMPALSG